MDSLTPVNITGKLCELCHQFTSDIFAFNFTPQESYPGRWHPAGAYQVTGWFPERPWGDGFHHHETLQGLQESAGSCELCYVLHHDLSQMEQDLCQGWLGLYPWWESARVGPNWRKGHFRAGFRESLTRMPGPTTIGSVPLHSFRVCRRPLHTMAALQPPDILGDFRGRDAVPPTLDPSYLSLKVTMWRQQCLEKHKQCAVVAQRPKPRLPTRVLDLAATGTDKPVLYESMGEVGDYVALSHCWGGNMPSVTNTANLEQRLAGIDVGQLARNFQDAIRVTRDVGIRYLWIDALCIIQDSREDWVREAARMAEVYAGAKMVVSALDASSSTVGFLHPGRIPLAVVNEQYALQKVSTHIYDYIRDCPITARGWCMQERLLGPTMLHIGKEQMYWECLEGFEGEDGTCENGQSTGHVAGLFIALRAKMGISIRREWKEWYGILEEYTARRLTMPGDKLPAVAGAAVLFQTQDGSSSSSKYVAGLWREDLRRGLLWGAHYDHQPGRKVWGYSTSDTCSELSEPATESPRAPSWSWAAVDGQIDHWALRIGNGEDWCEVLDVAMTQGDNDLTEEYPRGRVRVRGPVEHVLYHPPDPKAVPRSVGLLSFADNVGADDMLLRFGGCTLDLGRDRTTPRSCWAFIVARSNSDRYMLVLDQRQDGSFKRIGLCTAYRLEFGPRRFAMGDVDIS